ncbi:MAG TPA: glycine betaine ABC transporter substrate-binding protein [Thermoanaerobaculia bacterium]|jgi:glycine betaine/choline ABC-type transport system substrate-binding protein|nr:glycine betaine ABC transporter substrate-binding protein [Thermoanaerobaculia bacterium]
MKRAIAALLAASAALAIACGSRGERPIRIGSKNFTEQVILGELAAGVLENAGLRVDRRLDLGGTFVCHRAIVAGELDLYPEYTGTAYTAILAHPPVSDPAAVRATVGREYPPKFHAVWGPPLGFDNTFALVMRRAQAGELGIGSISDLAQKGSALRPGFGYEFLERADGFPGLAKTYGLRFTQRPAEMDLGLLYAALDQRKVDVVAGNSTDGLIAAMNLVVLRDDKRYFPPYEAAFVVREPVWSNPRAKAALERLSGTVTADAMRAMNAAVDRDRRRPQDVAREFLARLGR